MLLIIISVLLVLITYLFISRVRYMSKLARNGIPGPKPNLIYGNMFEVRALATIKKQEELIKKYGKIVGYYIGRRPTVLVADPELAKNIQIKDFQYFADRPHSYMKVAFMPFPRFQECW